MLSFDGVGEEVFFDSAEYFLLSSEEPVVVKEDLLNGNLGFEVWLKEPQSVNERRYRFLRRMGFVELARASKEEESDEMMGLERVVECSGTVSSCYTPRVEENLVCYGRELSCEEANCGFDELEQDQVCNLSVALEGETYRSHVKECRIFHMDKKNLRNWWKKFIKNKRMGTRGTKVLKPICETPNVNRMKVHQKKKKCMELSAVYVGQEIQAHEGFIWSMKFSPDGQYLASGGEDGVIRIWRVMQADASCKEKESLHAQAQFGGRRGKGGKKRSHLSVVVPDKVFQIEELPLQEFHGHTSDVLDLACVFFHHRRIKLSVYGKWAAMNVLVFSNTMITGFIVGCVTGTCRFYGASDGNLQLTTVINFRGRNKSSSNKITGIQFNQEDSQRVMITSEDCKVRILDGTDIVRKYRGNKSTKLAPRRQTRLPFKKQKVDSGTVKHFEIDPARLMYRSNILGVIKTVLELELGDRHIWQLEKTPFWPMVDAIRVHRLDPRAYIKCDAMVCRIIHMYHPGDEKFYIGGVGLPLRNNDIHLMFGIKCGKDNLDLAQSVKEDNLDDREVHDVTQSVAVDGSNHRTPSNNWSGRENGTGGDTSGKIAHQPSSHAGRDEDVHKSIIELIEDMDEVEDLTVDDAKRYSSALVWDGGDNGMQVHFTDVQDLVQQNSIHGNKQWVVDHHTNYVKPKVGTKDMRTEQFDGALVSVVDCPE
ncbi:putative WD repeat-containing protein C3H5.08c [Camellia lanceoleosa]|uniref:WD repeat-containing protein C3H5.08c n=1 Tax=Camellia lanceoleosa TaxID=1840588 RepID=A0ACC0IYZ1_9ERIC|nr:putative WD repeat-containing protein C3H5.08c [Camellia lanceoleosa]